MAKRVGRLTTELCSTPPWASAAVRVSPRGKTPPLATAMLSAKLGRRRGIGGALEGLPLIREAALHVLQGFDLVVVERAALAARGMEFDPTFEGAPQLLARRDPERRRSPGEAAGRDFLAGL